MAETAILTASEGECGGKVHKRRSVNAVRFNTNWSVMYSVGTDESVLLKRMEIWSKVGILGL